MKKLICLTMILYLLPSSYAFFPSVHQEAKYNQVAIMFEGCSSNADFKIWGIYPAKKFKRECSNEQLDLLIKCNIEEPKNYSCMTINQQVCYDTCKSQEMVYEDYQSETCWLFGCRPEKCWCEKNGKIVRGY